MEELLAKHRKEQRDLQARISQKKKNATKKTRKGINDECEVLERDLLERQRTEIEALEPTTTDLSTIENGVQDLGVDGDGPPQDDRASGPGLSPAETTALERSTSPHVPGPQAPAHQGRTKKPNRQKARLARRAAEQEAQATAAAAEAANLPDLREQEMTAMSLQLDRLGLTETQIRPDGHCLFSACAIGISPQQVTGSGPHSEPYRNVRFAAADFISKHPGDFAPFLEEPLDSYVQKIRDTAEWGGQPELQAIAGAYHVEINVLQADGKVERIRSGKENDDAEKNDGIWLAYYRHSFGLGEHYNALKKMG